MSGKIVGDDEVVPSDLLIFEQVTPLVVVTPGRMLTDQRLAGAILVVENLVFQPVDVERHVMAGHGRNARHVHLSYIMFRIKPARRFDAATRSAP